MHARAQSPSCLPTQRRIADSLGGTLAKVDLTLASIGGTLRESNTRRLIELFAVALASAALAGAATLAGVWALIH